MNKQIMLCPNNGISLNNKKEPTIDTHNYMDESQNNNFVEWKKLGQKK